MLALSMRQYNALIEIEIISRPNNLLCFQGDLKMVQHRPAIAESRPQYPPSLIARTSERLVSLLASQFFNWQTPASFCYFCSFQYTNFTDKQQVSAGFELGSSELKVCTLTTLPPPRPFGKPILIPNLGLFCGQSIPKRLTIQNFNIVRKRF